MKSDLFATGNSLVMEEECMLNPPQPYWEQEPNDSGTLVSCIQSLTFLTQILRHDNTGSMCTGAREQIKHVIERTALWSSEKGSVRDHAIALLSEIEVDSKKRACFIDEATLFGLMTTLQGLQKFIQSESSKVTIISSNHEPLINRAIDMLSHILRSTISIARTRGGNYRKAVSGMIAAKVSSASIAVEAKNILDVCQYQKSLYGVNTLHFVQTAQLISELILIEIACSDSSDFAQFDVLASFLMYPDSEIVKACCAAISNSLRSEGKLTSPERVELSSQDHFVTYQCDSCKGKSHENQI